MTTNAEEATPMTDTTGLVTESVETPAWAVFSAVVKATAEFAAETLRAAAPAPAQDA